MKPLWKEAVLTWIGVNFTAFALAFTLMPLVAEWPWAAGFMAFNTAMVAALTWPVMPVLERLGRRWLDPRNAPLDSVRRRS